MGDVPTARLLAYHQEQPHLRLLTLPEGSVTPSPVPLDSADAALDRGFERDGWLVFQAFTEVFGVELPLGGDAFRVGAWWGCVPAPDPRTIWLANPDPQGPTVLVEYDGVRRQDLQRVELDQPVRLEAAVPDGLVLRPVDDDLPQHALLLWPWAGPLTPLAEAFCVIDAQGSMLAVSDRGGQDLTLVDIAARTEIAVSKPLVGEWGQSGTFSPDGAWLAIGLEAQARGGSEPSRLALIDRAKGMVTLAEGGLDNFATTPVWSHDSAWLVFASPFDEKVFVCDMRESPPSLAPILGAVGREAPLIWIPGS